MNYDDARHRYRTDAAFYNVVNGMRKVIEDLRLTPDEMHGAVMLASIMPTFTDRVRDTISDSEAVLGGLEARDRRHR